MSDPLYTKQPQSTAIMVGTTGIVLEVFAPNATSYSWTKGETPVSGATTRFLSLTDAQVIDAGDYFATAHNTEGNTFSELAKVVVYEPFFDPMPASQEPAIPASYGNGVSGTPEGARYGVRGDMVWDYTGNVLYVKDSDGYGNTGWILV